MLEPMTRTQSALLQTTRLQLALRYRELAASGAPRPSYRDVGFGVYCDADEDGIILYLLSIVGSGRSSSSISARRASPRATART
jgi:hypothetical protein